jgi:hypothetical protein
MLLEKNLTEKKSSAIATATNKSPFSEILTGAFRKVVFSKTTKPATRNTTPGNNCFSEVFVRIK